MTQQNSKTGFTFEQKIILFNLMLTLALVAVVFIAVWQIYQPKTAPQVIVVTATTQLLLPTAEPTVTKNSAYQMPPLVGTDMSDTAVVVTLSSAEDLKQLEDLMNQMKTDVAK